MATTGNDHACHDANVIGVCLSGLRQWNDPSQVKYRRRATVRYGYPETTSEVEGESSTLLPLGD